MRSKHSSLSKSTRAARRIKRIRASRTNEERQASNETNRLRIANSRALERLARIERQRLSELEDQYAARIDRVRLRATRSGRTVRVNLNLAAFQCDVNYDHRLHSKQRSGMDIDIEKLITLVQERPCLWEMKSTEYVSKLSRKNAWKQIVLQFAPEEADTAVKVELGRILQKKWKNIRDQYKRSLRQKPKSGGGAVSSSDYLYSRQLQFLRDTVLPTETGIIWDEGEENEQRDEPTTEWVKKKKTSHQFEENLLEEIRKNRIERERKDADENDNDKLFLLSLLPMMKLVPKHLKIDCRLDVLHEIKKCLSFQPSTTPFLVSQHSFPNQPFPQPAFQHQTFYAQGQTSVGSHSEFPSLTTTATCSSSQTSASNLSQIVSRPQQSQTLHAVQPTTQTLNILGNDNHSDESTMDIFS